MALMSGGESGEDIAIRRILDQSPRDEVQPGRSGEGVDQATVLAVADVAKAESRPVKRLTALAHELAADGLLADAGKKAHAELHKVLDGSLAK